MKNKTLTTFFLLSISLTAAAQNVQWAGKVINYSSQLEYESYSAKQALGEPNSMPSKGYATTAWAASSDDRKEFLQVGFDKPMKIKQVIIAENNAPGAIYRVAIYDTQKQEREVYKQKPDSTLVLFSRYFQIKFEETTFEVSGVKVSLDCRVISGVNQIDAIGISDDTLTMKAEAVKTTGDVKFYSDAERLSVNVNSGYEEVAPVISPDGRTLFFDRKDFPPHHNDDEIWYSPLDTNGYWSKAIHFPEPINNAGENAISSITPDGNTILLNGQYFKDGSRAEGISFSHRTVGGWSFPENGKIKNYYNLDRYINYYQTNDGKKLFMNVRREDSRGTSDLYISFLQNDGTWTEPKNLGATINSTGRECCAFLASDNATLYFASDGFNGFGSYDIYMSRRLDDTWQKWSTPLNIGRPVNSDAWDAYYTIPAKGDYAYFVRGGDIYRVRLSPEQKPNPVILVYGTVYNQKTKTFLPDASVHYEFLTGGNEAGIARTNPADGEYKIILPQGNAYGFRAEAQGFISVNDNLDATNLKEYTEIKRDLYLVPVEVGQVVRINNIFFDFGKSTLKSESFSELNRVVDFLNTNPTVSIELSGNTDNIGSDADNLRLSDDRAKAVVEYLTSKGIIFARLTAKGYGETKPVATNDTEEGKALNRRVEFVILKK
jgi:outer membrane protein OmpA-like peptidoglycan-associated protein